MKQYLKKNLSQHHNENIVVLAHTHKRDHWNWTDTPKRIYTYTTKLSSLSKLKSIPVEVIVSETSSREFEPMYAAVWTKLSPYTLCKNQLNVDQYGGIKKKKV